MDISKLTVEVDSDKFHDTYVSVLRKLFDEKFINDHHVIVESPMSFRRTFAKKAGIKEMDERTNHAVFTKEDMEMIVADTNDKYEESATGKYSESLAKKQTERYQIISRVLKHALTDMGFEETANKLLYADEPDKALPQEEEDKRKQEVEELNKYIDILKTSVKNLDSKLLAVEALDIISKEEKDKYLELQQELQRAVEGARKCTENKDYPEVQELNDFIAAATDILERLQMLQDKPEEKIVEESVPVQEEPVPSVGNEEQYQLSLNNNVATLIPLMTEHLKRFLHRCATEIEENKKTIANLTTRCAEFDAILKVGDETIERLIAETQVLTLPKNDEELYSLAKQAIENISDKDKIKDLVMTGMKKI